MGTTKSIESKYSTPCNNLYPTCPWDLKILKRYILDKKLAPIYKGTDHERERHQEECPICSLWYPVLNRVGCCKNSICTECYVQIIKQPPHPNASLSNVKCPFCSIVGFSAVFKGPKPPAEREQEKSDHQLYEQVQARLKKEAEDEERKKREKEKEERERARLQAEATIKNASTQPSPDQNNINNNTDHDTQQSDQLNPSEEPIIIDLNASPPSNEPQIGLNQLQFNGGVGLDEYQVEEAMIEEAIRLSLQHLQIEFNPPPPPPPQEGSSSSSHHHNFDLNSDSSSSSSPSPSPLSSSSSYLPEFDPDG